MSDTDKENVEPERHSESSVKRVVICHCADCGKIENKEPLQEGFTQGELKVYKKYCEACIEKIAMETIGGVIEKLEGR